MIRGAKGVQMFAYLQACKKQQGRSKHSGSTGELVSRQRGIGGGRVWGSTPETSSVRFLERGCAREFDQLPLEHVLLATRGHCAQVVEQVS